MIRIAYNARLWERQEWDTKGSYENFRAYYFTQPKGSRSINEAWRKANPKRAETKSGRKKVAPANWSRWAAARTSSNKEIYIAVIQPDGSEKVRRAYTWAERAQAFDDQLAQRDIEIRQKAADQLAKNLERALGEAAQKVLDALAKYTPQGESLTTITLAMDRIAATAQKLKLIAGDNEDPIPDIDRDAAAGMKGQVERMQELAAILDRARHRKEERIAE